MLKSKWSVGLILIPYLACAKAYDDPSHTDMPATGVSTGKDICRVIPTPMVSVSVQSVYAKGDSTQSHVDQARKQTYDAYMAPLWDFVKLNSNYASRYEASKNSFFAHCALDALTKWADVEALTRTMTAVAQLNLGRNLSGIALAYKKVRNVANSKQKLIIDNWLRHLAERIPSYFDSAGLGETARGNLRYWNGLACAAIGDVVGDKHLVEWGLDSFYLGIKEVDSDGALPIEMKRGGRALSYQLYATAPLVMLAVIAKKHGVDVEARNNHAFARLVQFTVASALNPAKIIQKSGSTIKPYKKLSGERFAWIKVYENNFGAVSIDKKLISGPFYDPFLGGDLK